MGGKITEAFSGKFNAFNKANVGNTGTFVLDNNTGLQESITGLQFMQETSQEVEAVCTQLQSAIGNVDGVKALVGQIQNMSTSINTILQTINDSNAMNSNGELYNALNGVSDFAVSIIEQVNRVTQSIQELGQTTNQAYQQEQQSLQQITENLQNIVQFSSMTTQSVTSTVQKSSEANKEIQQFTRNITDSVDSARQHIHNSADRINELTNFSNKLSTLAAETAQDITSFNEHIRDLKEIAGNSRAVEDSMHNIYDKLSQVAGGTLIAQLDALINHVQNIDEAGVNNSNELVKKYVNDFIKQSSNIVSNFNESGGSLKLYRQLSDDMKHLKQSYTETINHTINRLQKEASQNADIEASVKQEVEELRGMANEISHSADDNLKQLGDIQRLKIQNSISNYAQFQADVNTAGTDANAQVTSDIINDNLNRIRYSSLVGGADTAIANLQYSSGHNSPWYQYVTTGNLLGNKADLANNLRNVQRHGYAAKSYFDDLKGALGDSTLSNADKATNIANFATANSSLVDSILETGKGMHFGFGGGKNLTQRDKQTLDSFSKQIKEALENITASISAIESFDPNNETLKQLKKEQSQLAELQEKAEKAKNSSTALANAFDMISTGVHKLKNILATGLGIAGLGALLSPSQMIGKAIDYETQEGQRRYNVAKTDFYMGANLNQARIYDIARTKSNYYWKLTNGMIGDNEYAQYYSDMAHSVGGHYGGNPEDAAMDMANITDRTFAIAKRYDIGNSSVAGVMKSFYKDLGMSASQASQVLVDLAQTATSSNIPVEKYVNTVTSMVDSLRNQGVDGMQVKASMHNLVNGRNLRVEDAQSLVQSQANANHNMAMDINGSAFWGMMAGQGGDPIALANQGLMAFGADGKPKQGYWQMMGQRVMASANFMGAIGGDNSLGQMMMLQDLMSKGYSHKDASMVVDAAAKGDSGLVEKLLMEGEEHKDGGKQSISEAMTEAKEKLEQAGNQVSEFQKLDTELADAQKKIGQAMHMYLAEPLKAFREGFTAVLQKIVEYSQALISAVSDFITGNKNTDVGKFGNFVADNKELVTGGAILATIAGAVAYRKGLPVLKNGLNKALGSSTGMALRSGFGKTTTLFGTAGLAALVGTGMYSLSTLVQMFRDGTANVTANATRDNSEVEQILGNFHTAIDQKGDEILNSDEFALKEDGNGFDPNIYDSQDTYNKIKEFDAQVSEQIKDDVANTETSEEIGQRLADKSGGGSFLADVGKALGFGTMVNSGIVDAWKAGEGFKGSLANLFKGGGTSIFKGGLGAMAKSAGKMVGTKIPFLNLAINGVEEYMDAQNPEDTLTTGQHVARTGIKTLTQMGGSALGAFLGSFAGPVGTVAGGAIGGFAGDYVGDKLLDVFGLSNTQDYKTQHDRYTRSVNQSKELYGEATNSLVHSNEERGKAARKAFNDHKLKIEDVTKEQEKFMNDLYDKLRSMGLSEQVAAFLAANQVADAQQQGQQDPKVQGLSMKEWGTVSMEDTNPNEETFATHATGATAYIAGAMLADKTPDDELTTLIDMAKSSGYRVNSNDWNEVLNSMYNNDMETAYKAIATTRELPNAGAYRNAFDTDKAKRVLQLAEYFSSAENRAKHPQEYEQFKKAFTSRASEITSDKANGGQGWERYVSKYSGVNGGGSSNPNKAAEDIVKDKTGANKPDLSHANARAEILKFARAQIGKEYEYGAVGPNTFDCSGLSMKAFGAGGIDLVRTADAQYEQVKKKGGIFTDQRQAKPGDLVFFDKGDGVHHVGIYTGNGKMIDAGTSAGITERDVSTFAGENISYGDASALGADDGSGLTGSEGGSSQAENPVDALDKVLAGRESLIGQMGNFAGLKDKELLADKIATGQLILDGTTAMGFGGKYMSLRGARNNFRLHSGVKDKDLFGYGLHGGFSGTGEATEGDGPLGYNQKFEEKFGVQNPRKIQLDGFESTREYVKNMDEIKRQYDANHEKQLETYRQAQESQKKAQEEKENDTQSAKITCVSYEQGEGKTKEAITSLNARLTTLAKQYAQLSAEQNARI